MRRFQNISWLVGVLLACGALRAAPAPAAVTNNHPARPLPPTPPPPLPPRVPSPVDQFRQLLAMGPAERERWLASRSEQHRAYLRGQLREFDALSPRERELRLRLLQLRYYLVPLMKTAPADRHALLAQVPPPERALITTRLVDWDRLPADQQQELLDDEKALDAFSIFSTRTEAERQDMIARAAPELRQRLESQLTRWQDLPAARRERLTQHFNQFFTLSDSEKEKVLGLLSDPQRRRTERMLAAFEHLPAEQRARCIAALNRFINLTAAERDQFWCNAARWESMTPEERRAWRAFTADLPPMPPGMGPAQPPPPPVPPAARAPTNAQAAR
jgi:hypothetical protein